MFRQKPLADARLVVEAVQRRFGCNACQIAVALFAFGKHQQVVICVAFGRCALNVVIVLLAHVEFTAHDGLDPYRLGRVHKVHRAKNVAMVGHRDRGHAQLFCAFDELFDVACAVEHRVIGMQVEVYELGHVL